MSFAEGVWDSIKNISVVFYLDKEMNEKLAKKAEKNLTSQSSQSADPTKKTNKEKKKE